MHAVTPIKMALNLLGALTVSTLLPWTLCAAWAIVGLGIEVWSWFATRRRARGEPFSRGGRANFAICYVVINLWWLLLGALLVSTGTMAGLAAGGVMMITIASVAVLLFPHRAGGGSWSAAPRRPWPPLAVIALDDSLDWRQMLPIWGALGLCFLFNLGRAIETPSTQEQQRRLNDSLNRFQILTENVSEIIARIDLDGVHQYVSPACFALLGYRPDEMVGQARREIVHPDSLPRVHAAIAPHDGRSRAIRDHRLAGPAQGGPLAVAGDPRQGGLRGRSAGRHHRRQP